jgi:hypothetical protein
MTIRRSSKRRSFPVPDPSPTTRAAFAALLDRALERASSYEQALPGVSLFVSVREQLSFMARCVQRDEPPADQDLQRINVGLLAVRELQETDPEFADWLMDLDYAFKRWPELS